MFSTATPKRSIMVVEINRKKLEELILRASISKEETAKKLCITQSYLSILLNGNYGFYPSPALRKKMISLFKVSFDDLFFIRSGRFVNRKSLAMKAKVNTASSRKVPAAGVKKS
jgi:transcriptional regulator with XRE-family HTH domain